MYLNQRCYLVLKTIIDNPSITGKKLEERLNLSRKQVSYTIDKINDYLEQNGFSKIERLRTGKFNIPLFVIEEFQSKEIETDIKNYVFSSQERSDLLLLLLLSIGENLSSYHFTSALGISKNTLISDLKKLKNIIGLFNISLFYSRAEGYTLMGTELSKRDLLIYAIKNVLGIKNGESIILKLCDIKNEKLYRIKEEIEEIETKLNIRFTDKRLKELPYILYLIIRRIDIGRMPVELPKAFQHMKGTKEYSVVNEMTENLGISNPLEKMYLTAQIQVSNIHHFEKNKNKVEKNLVTVVKAVIEEFEKHCCIRFKEKDKLLEAFIQHCGPAVYRILYNYHIEPNITDMFLTEHQYLHQLVKKSVAPLEALVGRELPDEELVYLTVLLGAWLRREGFLDFVEAKRRGVVVCTKGVSISNYLLITLKELFPEIEFIASLSVREFNDYQENYSIVFSTVRVKTEKTQFLVKPFLNDQEKQSFREKVFQELEGINLHTIQIEELIKIVREHSIIYNETKMEKALKKYISRSAATQDKIFDRQLNRTFGQEILLKDLLTDDTVMVSQEVLQWEEAIRKISEPLLRARIFEERYILRMIEIINVERSYIMIADGVVIAHAGVDDGVNQVGMGMMKLPKKIAVGDYMDADIMIVLGTPDRTIHLNALSQLNRILESEKSLERIRLATRTEEILEIIHE